MFFMCLHYKTCENKHENTHTLKFLHPPLEKPLFRYDLENKSMCHVRLNVKCDTYKFRYPEKDKTVAGGRKGLQKCSTPTRVRDLSRSRGLDLHPSRMVPVSGWQLAPKCLNKPSHNFSELGQIRGLEEFKLGSVLG